MRRLLSVRIWWRIHGILDHTQMLSGLPYGRTQRVRDMHSSIVSVKYYVSTRLFYVSCDVR